MSHTLFQPPGRAFATWLATPRTGRVRAAIVAAAWVAFLVVDLTLYPFLGRVVHVFAALPPLLMGLLFGGRAALVGMGLALLATTALSALHREPFGSSILARTPGYLVLAFTLWGITALRRLLLELTAAYATLERVFEALPDALFLVDERGHIAYINPMAENILGYRAEELIGRPIEDLVPPEQRELHQRQRMAYQVAPRVRPMGLGLELYALHKDGRRVPVDISLAPVTLPHGRYTIAAMRDLSFRKETEARIRRLEARYRRLFQFAPVMAVLTYDWEGEPLISDCNAMFLAQLGYERDEVVGRPLADFYTPASREALRAGGYHAAMTEGLWGVERQLVTKDGRVVETLLFAAPEEDAQGHVIGTIAMFVDVTEQKQMEQALRFRERELLTRSRILAAALEATQLEPFLQRVLGEVVAFSKAEMGGIFVREGDAYVLRAWQNVPDALRAAFVQVPADASYEWLREFTLAREPLSATGRISDVAKRVGIQARVSLPLYLPHKPREDGPLAVIMLAARDITAFNDEEVAALRTMADQIALALGHLQATRQAQERLYRLQVLRRIDQAILSRQELQDIVRTVLEGVPRDFGADAMAVSLVDEESGDLELFALRLPDGSFVEPEAFAIAETLRWFMSHPRPLVVPDLHQDPRVQGFRDLVRSYRLASYLGCPLTVEDQFLGVLHVLTTEFRTFTDEDLAFFETLAGQTAIALVSARLLSDLRTRARAVETVLHKKLPTHQELVQEGVPDRFLLQVWREALGVAAVELYRVDPIASRVRLQYREGLTGPTLEFPLGAQKGLVGWVAQTRQAVYIRDCQADPRWVPALPQIRSAYVVPLLWQDTLLGVVAFLSDRPRAFPPASRRIVDLLVQYGAAVLENARQTREEAARAAMLEALSEVATTLEAARTVEQVVTAIGEGTLRLCRPDKAAVFLREKGRVRPAWFHGFTREFVEALANNVWELPNGHVLKDGEAAFIGHVREFPADSPVRLWAERGGYQAFGLLPLVHEHQTIGYLGCYWAEPYCPAPYEQEVMQTFARLAAVALDTTRLYEELERTNAALEEALKAREDMIRNVTHELRTPLTMVRGYAELIETGMTTDLNEIREHAQVILRNALHLQRLIDQLLLFQRLRFGDVEAPFSQVELISWLEETLREWEQPMAEAHITLVFQPEARQLPVMVYADYLRRVVDILLDNARKFSPKGGTVRVRAWREGQEAYVAVSDEGIGIPPDKLDKIFERFYQVDPSPTRRFGGMGIGLALCKEIVERHGGRIWAESEGEGKGTTVIFALPLAGEIPT